MYLVLASINVVLLKWPPQHSRLTIRKEYELHVLTNNKTYIYFFHQIFYQVLFYLLLQISFFKPAEFCLMLFINSSDDKKTNDKFFTGQSKLTFYILLILTFYKLSSSRTCTRGVFRTQLNIYNKDLWVKNKTKLL